MSEATFRFSTLSDHGNIVRMSGHLFGGVDAMEEIYPALMSDPAFHGVVGESNGEIIAFGGAYVLMGGRKLYSFGGRVRSDWRGKKVYGQLKEFLRTRLRQEQHPLLAQEEFFTHGDNPVLQGLLNSKTYRHICSRSVQLYNFTSDERSCSLKGEKTSISAIKVESVGMSGLMSLLMDAENCRRTFPDRLYIGMLMFDPDVQNYPFIKETEPVVVVSYAETSGSSVVSTGRKHKASQYIIQFHFDTNTVPLPPVLAEHFVLHINKHIESKARSKQYQAFCLFAPKIYFSETINLIECSGFEGIKIFEDHTLYGFCRDI